MKKNQMAKKIMTYVLLLGAVGLVAVYFLVYKDYKDKTTSLENSSNQIQSHIDELQVYKDNRETYETEIATMRTSIVDMTDQFPADVKEEDYLYMALATLNVEERVTYESVNVSEREEMCVVSADEIAEAGVESLDDNLVFARRTGALVNKTNYKGLKECVEVIDNLPDKHNISSISFSRNKEENCLEGTIEVTSYILLGTDKEYVSKNFGQYEAGVEDLFNLKSDEEWFYYKLKETLGIENIDSLYQEQGTETTDTKK